MIVKDVFEAIAHFSSTPHGSSDFHENEVYLIGEKSTDFAPLTYLEKKIEKLIPSLVKEGFMYDSFDLFAPDIFKSWYEKQFSRKLKRSFSKRILFFHLPDNKAIFDSIETVNKNYEILASQKVLMNNKKLPVQLGEWYAKSIFGLQQRKSTSQKGFDFYLSGVRVEIKVHWGDQSSPKGIKLRKSLVELSEFSIVIYVAKNFMIREICFLDSKFVLRKFSGKGHTIFLKDADVSSYFFCRSSKHYGKVLCPSTLLKYSSPVLAMKLAEHFK